MPDLANVLSVVQEDFEPRDIDALSRDALQKYQPRADADPAGAGASEPQAKDAKQDKPEKAAKAQDKGTKDSKKNAADVPPVGVAPAVLALVRALSRLLSSLDEGWQEYAQVYVRVDLSKLVEGLATVLPEGQARLEALQAELDKVYPNCRKTHPFYEQKLAFLESCRENPPEPALEKYLVNTFAAAGRASTLFITGISEVPGESAVLDPAPVQSRPSSALGNASKTSKPKAAAKGAKAGDEAQEAYVPPALLQTYCQRLVASELASSVSQHSRLFTILGKLGVSVSHDVKVVVASAEERDRLARYFPDPAEAGPGAPAEGAVLYRSELETPAYAVAPRARALEGISKLPPFADEGRGAGAPGSLPGTLPLPGEPSALGGAGGPAGSPRLGSFESTATAGGRKPGSRSRYPRAGADDRQPDSPPAPHAHHILGLALECAEPAGDAEQAPAGASPPRSASKGLRASSEAPKSPAAQKAGKKAAPPDASADPAQPSFNPADNPDFLLTRPRLATLCGYWAFRASCLGEIEAYAQDALELSAEGRCTLP